MVLFNIQGNSTVIPRAQSSNRETIPLAYPALC